VETSVGAATGKDPERIRAAGWGQCSVISPSDLELLRAQNHLSTGTSDMCGIVLSQSCDVVAASYEEEPVVEIIVADPLMKSDWHYVRLRNPRVLHLPITVDGAEKYHELLASRRATLPRPLFEGIVPDPGRLVSETSRRHLRMWIVDRYIRAAFPNEFVRRLGKVEKRLETLFKKRSSDTTGVWVLLNTQEELDEATPYIIDHPIVTMRTTAYSDRAKRGRADEFALQLGKILDDCDGITADIPELRPESRFTLDDLGVYQRLDKSTFDVSE
jgi:hypothetical protein